MTPTNTHRDPLQPQAPDLQAVIVADICTTLIDPLDDRARTALALDLSDDHEFSSNNCSRILRPTALR